MPKEMCIFACRKNAGVAFKQSSNQAIKDNNMQKTPIQIRFNDVDQMGHVNNAVIMEYLDLGKDAFFSGHGLSPTKSDFTVMVVHYDVDFKAQIHYHDKIQVETSIERFGT